MPDDNTLVWVLASSGILTGLIIASDWWPFALIPGYMVFLTIRSIKVDKMSDSHLLKMYVEVIQKLREERKDDHE